MECAIVTISKEHIVWAPLLLIMVIMVIIVIMVTRIIMLIRAIRVTYCMGQLGAIIVDPSIRPQCQCQTILQQHYTNKPLSLL